MNPSPKSLQIIIIILLLIIVGVIIYSYWDFYSCNKELFPASNSNRPTQQHTQQRSQQHSQQHTQQRSQQIMQKPAQQIMQKPGQVMQKQGQPAIQKPSQQAGQQAGQQIRQQAGQQIRQQAGQQAGQQVRQQISQQTDQQANQSIQATQANNQMPMINSNTASRMSYTKNDKPEQGIYKFAVYHMEGCGHCSDVMSVKSEKNNAIKFETLKNIFGQNPNIQILDFQYQRDQEANKYNAFPVIKLITPDDEIEYNGPRTVRDMAQFIKDNTS
jgi:hypothetical protein